jgi:antitoxin component YwqK of YwqJK toxin-antitoxin module
MCTKNKIKAGLLKLNLTCFLISAILLNTNAYGLIPASSALACSGTINSENRADGPKNKTIVFSNSNFKTESKPALKTEFTLGQSIFCKVYFEKELSKLRGDGYGGFGIQVYINGSEKLLASGGQKVASGETFSDVIFKGNVGVYSEGTLRYTVMEALMRVKEYQPKMKVEIRIYVKGKTNIIAKGSFTLINFSPKDYKRFSRNEFRGLKAYKTSANDQVNLSRYCESDQVLFRVYWNQANWKVKNNAYGNPIRMSRYASYEMQEGGVSKIVNGRIQRAHLGGGAYGQWEWGGNVTITYASLAFIKIDDIEGFKLDKKPDLSPKETRIEKDGQVLVQYSTGELKSEENYLDGKKHGKFVNTDATSFEIIKEEIFDQGTIVSSKTYFYSDGQLKSTRYYENGELSGACENFRKDGEKQSDLIYSKGVKIFHKEYDSYGKVSFEGNYDLDGEKHGHLKTYHRGYETMKTDIEYVHGIKNGLYTEFYRSGLKEEQGTYLDGERTGVVNYYRDKTGSPRSSYRTDLNGKRNGKSGSYYSNGKVKSETTYLDGNKNGPYVKYNDAGKKISEGSYLDDRKNGDWLEDSKIVRYEKGKKL